ncbi:GNAT family N-acetyltransferase [Rhodobacter sp. Har01]|uniref:GNAT family N-acetyltransferase n=1 Tax=Rhodobacter sp. Har01 TaxID=2883999 RepID=UPI001D08F71D|nr:GNAT family N-acetyltransferase [Rhodobacter sp. Har01]MCB6177713.1 GNAT family N-acetyltransferase [Rhodobacter sp. Har01]
MIIRPATLADAPAMTDLLNRIIAIGGTTAHQHPKPAERVLVDCIDGPHTLTCMVAELDGRVVGFQSVGRNPQLPASTGDIGTFIEPGLQAKGLGAQLFVATLAAARGAGLCDLNATIRADNVPGLAYCARIGFVDCAHDPDWALDDGRVVGRVSRRFVL